MPLGSLLLLAFAPLLFSCAQLPLAPFASESGSPTLVEEAAFFPFARVLVLRLPLLYVFSPQLLPFSEQLRQQQRLLLQPLVFSHLLASRQGPC